MTDLLFDWFDFNQRASKYVSNSIEVRYQLTSDSKQAIGTLRLSLMK